MILEDLLLLIVLSVHHPSSESSTHPQWVLPIQMMGGKKAINHNFVVSWKQYLHHIYRT